MLLIRGHETLLHRRKDQIQALRRISHLVHRKTIPVDLRQLHSNRVQINDLDLFSFIKSVSILFNISEELFDWSN